MHTHAVRVAVGSHGPSKGGGPHTPSSSLPLADGDLPCPALDTSHPGGGCPELSRTRPPVCGWAAGAGSPDRGLFLPRDQFGNPADVQASIGSSEITPEACDAKEPDPFLPPEAHIFSIPVRDLIAMGRTFSGVRLRRGECFY